MMNFQIETTSFCDLTCSECPNVFLKRKRQFMDMYVWDTIIDKYVIPFKHVNGHLNPPTLIPSKDGEPMLNKRLPEMLALASQAAPDLNFAIYTHGLLLPKMPLFVDFLGSLPNKTRLLVTYHFYNHDGSVNEYGRTTQYLLSRKNDWPANVELILASHLIPPMVREDLNIWKEGWQYLLPGVQVHANVEINPWTGLIPEGKHQHHGCPYENFDHVFFGVTGNIVACCMDLEEEIKFGNVMTADPQEMLGTVSAFYAAQKRREMNHDVCSNCFGVERTNLVQLGTI
jgi:hypothetical protein